MNGFAIGLGRRNITLIAGRKSAAEIDHAEFDALGAHFTEDHGGRCKRLVPGLGVGLL